MLHFVWLNSTVTAPFHPLFEIIYALEGGALLLFLMMMPLSAAAISLATPLHRNVGTSSFRIIFLLVLVHMTIGTFSRIALIYHQLFSEADTHTNLPSIASIFRAMFFTFSMLLPLTVSIERFLATRWWEWYERQSSSTLAVFLGCFLCIETGVLIPSFCVVFEIYSLPVQMTLFAFYLCLGISQCSFLIFFYLLHRNNRYQVSLTARRITTRYTVAKHYQVKENLLVFAMLRKIAVPATVGAIPAFVFFSTYLAIPEGECDFIKYFSVALFDWHISLYALGLLNRICTCDRRFIRGFARIPFFGRIIMRKTQPERTMSTEPKNESDDTATYFAQLAGDLAGPPTKNK